MNIFIQRDSLKQAFSKLVISVNLTSWPYGEMILVQSSLWESTIGHIDPELMKTCMNHNLTGPPHPQEYHTVPWERKAPKAMIDYGNKGSWWLTGGQEEVFWGRKAWGNLQIWRRSVQQSAPLGASRSWFRGWVGEREKGEPGDNSYFPTLHFFPPFPRSPPVRPQGQFCHSCHLLVSPLVNPLAA